MAKAHILILFTWTLLAVGMCNTVDTCARPRDNVENIRSLESKMDKKLTQLQAALDSLAKQTADLTSKVIHLATQGNLTRDDLTAHLDWPDVCGTCEKVIEVIYDLMEQGQTVERALGAVCNLIPWPGSTACKWIVKEIVEELLPLLEQKLPPSTICNTVGLCSRLSTNLDALFLDMMRTYHEKAGEELKPQIRVKPRQCCCHQCGKSFSSIYYLKVDQKIHTGEKPYGCVQCGEKFSLMAAPKVHQRFHTEEKPYCCEHCGKRFTVKSSLVQHKKIHTGERPYCCHQCGKRFTLKTALKRHLKIHTDLPAHLDWPSVCGSCEKVIEVVYDIMGEGHAVEYALDVVCDLIPWPGSTACQWLVNTFAGELIELLEQKLPPSTICNTVRLCSRLSTKLDALFMDMMRTYHEKAGEELKSQIGGTVHAAPSAEVKLPCPDFWYNHDGRCYKYVSLPMSWPEAELNCVGQDTNLVSIHSQGEQDFVRALIKNFDPQERSTWIGLTDTQLEGRWMWSDGSRVSYTWWDHGEPNGGRSENCVNTDEYNHKWNDMSCSVSLASVCELRTVSP